MCQIYTCNHIVYAIVDTILQLAKRPFPNYCYEKKCFCSRARIPNIHPDYCCLPLFGKSDVTVVALLVDNGHDQTLAIVVETCTTQDR